MSEVISICVIWLLWFNDLDLVRWNRSISFEVDHQVPEVLFVGLESDWEVGGAFSEVVDLVDG